MVSIEHNYVNFSYFAGKDPGVSTMFFAKKKIYVKHFNKNDIKPHPDYLTGFLKYKDIDPDTLTWQQKSYMLYDLALIKAIPGEFLSIIPIQENVINRLDEVLIR